MTLDNAGADVVDAEPDAVDLNSPKALQILDAAGCLFFEQGFGATSMGQIASHAGVSKGTLYNYFKDKDALFGAVVRSACRLQNADLFSLEAGDGDIDGVLRHVASQFVQFITSEHPIAAYRIVIAEAPRFPDLGRIFFESGPKAGIERLANYLGWAANQGQIRIDDPVTAAREFLEFSKISVHMQCMLSLRGPVGPEEAEKMAAGAVDKFFKLYPLT